jgi:inhibitor of KinA
MRTSAGEGARFQFASDQSLLIYFDQSVKEGSASERIPDEVHLKVYCQVGAGAAVRACGTSSAGPLQSQITLEANEKVRKLLRLLQLEPVAGVRNLHPAYCSVLVKFDALQLRHGELEAILRRYLARLHEVKLPEPRQVEIPVCYGGEFGPDLEEVAARRGIKSEQVIGLHSASAYRVYFLGFVPGFAYLGELPQQLVTPRLATPRKKVLAGSVGIAGNQTGVYPFATPGGWRLLGRTPVPMFRAEQEGLSLLSIGDCVRFTPISPERFAELERTWA